MKGEGLLLEYYVPLKQSATVDGEFFIEGIAINETTTSNGHVFVGEELSKAARTLNGVPLLKDHINSVDSVVGRVKNAYFDESLRAIPFKAQIADEGVKNKIKQGLINSVSVGAHVKPEDIVQLENGDIQPTNIIFKELSVVAVPADSGATFEVALNNAYNRYKEDLTKDERRFKEQNMSEETEIPKTEETKEESQETVEEEQTEEPKEEQKEESVEESAIDKLTERINALEETIKKLQEADKDEEKEEAEEESEEAEESDEEEEEAVEEDSQLNIVEGYRSFSYVPE